MNTTVWLISFTGSDGKPAQVVHAHNCIADYRQFDPGATVQAIECAAIAELIHAADYALQTRDDAGALSDTAEFNLRAALAAIGAKP